MSKGRGKKIVIRFTESLLGDVSGNESAFTVKGLQPNPLHFGEPELTEFEIESVERYPTAELWRDDFSGQKDGVELGENGLVLESAEPIELSWVDGNLNLPDSVFSVIALDTLVLNRDSYTSATSGAEYFMSFSVNLDNVDELIFKSTMSDRGNISSAVWVDGSRLEISSANYAKQTDSVDVSALSGITIIAFGLFTRGTTVKGRVEFFGVWLDDEVLIPEGGI